MGNLFITELTIQVSPLYFRMTNYHKIEIVIRNSRCLQNFLFRTGYPFQRRFLERGVIFRTCESSSFVSSHLTFFIQGQIAFKNTVQCVNN